MIRIVTDTASDISLPQAKKMGVDLVRLSVTFGDAPYDQDQDENFDTFYQMLGTSKQLPVTSQPSPDAFLSVFNDAKKNGEEVIAILLTSKVSGTVQSATIAKELCDYDKIHIIDSMQGIIGQRLLVEYALRLRDEQKSAKEIIEVIEDAYPRVKIFAALDTLKYLRKGGRIPKTAEMIGTMMGIKPLVKLEDGMLVMAGKARGHAGAVTSMMKLVGENADFDPVAPVYFGYSGTPQQLIAFRKLCTQKFQLKDTATHAVGAVIGTHLGPGAFAIAYLTKN